MDLPYDYDSDSEDECEDKFLMTPAEIAKRRKGKKEMSQEEKLKIAGPDLMFFNHCVDGRQWALRVDEMKREDLRVREDAVVCNPTGVRNSSDNLFPYAMREFDDQEHSVSVLMRTCQQDIDVIERENSSSLLAKLLRAAVP